MKLDDVGPPERRPSGVDCVFSALDDVFDDADRAKVAGWFADRKLASTAIADRLTEATGIQVNHQSVNRHRLGRCDRCRTAGRVWA